MKKLSVLLVLMFFSLLLLPAANGLTLSSGASVFTDSSLGYIAPGAFVETGYIADFLQNGIVRFDGAVKFEGALEPKRADLLLFRLSAAAGIDMETSPRFYVSLMPSASIFILVSGIDSVESIIDFSFGGKAGFGCDIGVSGMVLLYAETDFEYGIVEKRLYSSMAAGFRVFM